MNEFTLINTWFKNIVLQRNDVVLGIGDDAACLELAAGQQLLVSTDTLVSGVHFLPDWDAYDIAYRSVMVNVSDIVAMGGTPCWATLALTIPAYNDHWMERFSQGLKIALDSCGVALIGGDTTRGPLSITLTVHGQVPSGEAIKRSGAKYGDLIFVSGSLGAAALAVSIMKDDSPLDKNRHILMDKLLHPLARMDLISVLRQFASAAIDISDGLGADLKHLCVASNVGACLDLAAIPIHPIVKQLSPNNYLDLALSGGDDYEICFTISPANKNLLMEALANNDLICHEIGYIEESLGLRAIKPSGIDYENRSNTEAEIIELVARGYCHFVDDNGVSLCQE